MLVYRIFVVWNADCRDWPAQPYTLLLRTSKSERLVYTTTTLIITGRFWTCSGLRMLRRHLHCTPRDTETAEMDGMNPRHLRIH